jgi:hypothetical protein
MGNLVVYLDGTRYDFGDSCLTSGGCVSFDGDGNAEKTEGGWDISKWPKDFPEQYKGDVLYRINEEIRPGCCGGCV